MEYANTQNRSLPATVARAIALFNKVSDADQRTGLICRFEGNLAHVERRDGKSFRTKKSVETASVELRAAREKVRRVAEEGSRPLVNALAKIAAAKRLANDAWNS